MTGEQQKYLRMKSSPDGLLFCLQKSDLLKQIN